MFIIKCSWQRLYELKKNFMSPLQTESSCFHHIKTHRQQMGVVEVAACFFNLSLICVSPAEKRRLMQCDTCCSLVVTASGNLPVSSDCQLSKYWRTNFSDVLMNVYHSLFTATTCYVHISLCSPCKLVIGAV